MRTVSEIIQDCGGPEKIATTITAATRKPFSKDAVYKWPQIGIPDRHWPLLRKLTSVTPEELYEANVRARKVAA